MEISMNPSHVRLSVLVVAIGAWACTGEIDATGRSPGAGQSGAVGSPMAGASGTGGGGSNVAGNASDLTGNINLAGSPAYFRVVGLTKSQWRNSVRDIFGLTTLPEGADAFQEAVSGTTDFTNNELVLDVDSRGWTDFNVAAEQVAIQVASDPALLNKLYAGTDAAGFIGTVGRRVYRRPLAPEETARLQTLFELGAGNPSSFAAGAAVVLSAMLQSPLFLYRTELGPAGGALTGYEVATKLSLWLRDTTPNDALLDAAGRGELDSPQGVAGFAQQMMEEPAAKEVMRAFHSQLLHFDRFAELSKVGVTEYDPEIGSELVEASYLFFDKVFTQGLGLQNVFLSTSGFAGPLMSELYGLGPVAGIEERELGAGRLGYFTQLPFLMLYAHNDDPDAIHRGVSISLDVLCAPLGPPAAEIPALPMRRPGQTHRMVVDEHTSQCGGACHNQLINPLGFAFENFDGMGRHRTMEETGGETLPIDASGTFKFIDGERSWQNATELMQILAGDRQAHLCYSKKLASFGLQRDVVVGDMGLLDTLATSSIDGSLKQVVLALVQTDAYRTRAGGMP
jgi:hypothetical protein